MKDKITMADAWQDYRNKVIPKGAPQIQYDACRDSFYAGAIVVWGLLFSSLSPGSEAEPADMELLGRIQAEFDQFRDEAIARALETLARRQEGH